MGASRRRATILRRFAGRSAAGGKRAPVLGRLQVGTKLMLLVLAPVCVLLVFTVIAAVRDWRHASDLRHFQAATELSFATAGLADALAQERFDTAAQRLRPGARTRLELASAQRRVDGAARQATARVAGWTGTEDFAGAVDAVIRRLKALRTQATVGPLTIEQADSSYSPMVNNLLETVGNLDSGRPTQPSGRAADAYIALLQAIEAAERERVGLGEVLAMPGRDRRPASDPWATLESTELDAFRDNADAKLTAELDAWTFQPASIRVQEGRDSLAPEPRTLPRRASLEHWLSAAGRRVSSLRRIEADAARGLATTVSRDLRAAEANAVRDLAPSLAVLVIVTALGLLLRRSITRPLQMVSAGARSLSGGDLTFDVGHTGHDEIGDVAAALGDLRVTTERLAAEIRSMNTAVSDSRLDHRADVAAFEGTWSRLLAGMNETMAAFAGLHSREAALRRVATLVARGVPADEVFAAVVAEMHELMGADAARLLRYEPDGSVTLIAASDVRTEVPVGTRLTLESESLASVVRYTGRPARIEYDGAPGPIADIMREQGVHSSVGAPIVVDGRVWGMMAAVWKRRQPISFDTEGRIAQFTDLVATAIANAHSNAQLSASRARVVAASDETRRRIERDLHDGVQQRLVSLGLALRNAEATLPEASPELRSRIQQVVQGLTDALDELRAMSRGIHPAILSVGGLGSAVRTLARRSPVPVELDLEHAAQLPERVEIAAYYVVSEALTNVAKHAQASVVHVALSSDEETVDLAIRDDGVGGADPDRGSGLIGLGDRVEAIGGRLRIVSRRGAGTSVLVTLPIADDQPARETGPSPIRVRADD